jgi:hypothetical protein
MKKGFLLSDPSRLGGSLAPSRDKRSQGGGPTRAPSDWSFPERRWGESSSAPLQWNVTPAPFQQQQRQQSSFAESKLAQPEVETVMEYDDDDDNFHGGFDHQTSVTATSTLTPETRFATSYTTPPVSAPPRSISTPPPNRAPTSKPSVTAAASTTTTAASTTTTTNSDATTATPSSQPSHARTPIYPTTTYGVPKNALHALYSQPPRRKILDKVDFIAWNDGGPPHKLRFTAVFVCPLTGEVFPSGRYGDPQYYTVAPDGVVWYTKKTLAEHGAAARAWDCWAWRDCPPHLDAPAIGQDPPYPASQPMPLPINIHNDIRVKIEEARKKVLGVKNMDIDEENSKAWYQSATPDERA